MLLPLRATTGVVVADELLIFTQSPAVGEAGNVNVKVAVNTYVVEAAAAVLVLITDTVLRTTGVMIVGFVLNTTLVVPVEVVTPVPPFATAKVPANVIVPDDVIGPPDVVSPVVPPETATDVTVPVPGDAGDAHEGIPAATVTT
jgi:hypothetical protein